MVVIGFSFIAPKLFGFSIFWRWAYVMKVSPEARRVHKIRYLRFEVEGLVSKVKQGPSSHQRSILFPNRPSTYDSLAFYINPLFCSKKRFTLAQINVLYSEVYFYWVHQNIIYISCKNGCCSKNKLTTPNHYFKHI